MRDKSEEEILLSLIPKFLRRAFPAPTSKVLSDKEKDDRSSFILHLPLAAVLDCDCEAIIAINSWKTGNANDFRRAAAWLREIHPRLLLSEVIPERIAPTLPHTKSHLTDMIVWAVQYLFIYETACGHLDDNPWPSYRSARRQMHPRPRITGRSYTKLNVLPEREFNRLLRAAILGLQEEHKPLLFAVLLFLATPLSLEEICALNYGDFQTLHEYTDCLTVHISKTYERQEGHKNYQLRKIQDYYKQRIFPLSTIIKLGFDSLTPGSLDALLIHNPREPHRHYRPDHLLQYIRRECSAIIKTPQYKNKTPQQFLSLIKKTVENNYTTCQGALQG